MRFVLNRLTLVLEGTHDEVIVPVSLELDNGDVVDCGCEIVSDADATALARQDAHRRADEAWEDYEARVTQLVTWSQQHVRELVAARRAFQTIIREPVELVLATTEDLHTDGDQVDGSKT